MLLTLYFLLIYTTNVYFYQIILLTFYFLPNYITNVYFLLIYTTNILLLPNYITNVLFFTELYGAAHLYSSTVRKIYF
jgi:hypothetical protein